MTSDNERESNDFAVDFATQAIPVILVLGGDIQSTVANHHSETWKPNLSPQFKLAMLLLEIWVLVAGTV